MCPSPARQPWTAALLRQSNKALLERPCAVWTQDHSTAGRGQRLGSSPPGRQEAGEHSSARPMSKCATRLAGGAAHASVKECQ